jgi:hypothetical protein
VSLFLFSLLCIGSLILPYERETTPTLDRLADEGALFEWFVSTSQWSLPSHVTMFTGAYPHEQSGGFMERFDEELPTLAEVLPARCQINASARWGVSIRAPRAPMPVCARHDGP